MLFTCWNPFSCTPRCEKVQKFVFSYDIIVLCNSHNVLLNEHFTAKLSDFGFSVDLPAIKEGRTVVTAPLIACTEGYCPPEITSGQFSAKSDMYSYGVVSTIFCINNYKYKL